MSIHHNTDSVWSARQEQADRCLVRAAKLDAEIAHCAAYGWVANTERREAEALRRQAIAWVGLPDSRGF